MFLGPRRQVTGIEDLEHSRYDLDAECRGFLFQRHAAAPDLSVGEVSTEYQPVPTTSPNHVERRRPSALLRIAQFLPALRRRQVARLELPCAVTRRDVLRPDGLTQPGVDALVAEVVPVSRRELPAVEVRRGGLHTQQLIHKRREV